MAEDPTQTASEGSGAPLRESLSSSSERIELIIEAAERAAAGIIEDAEAQARRYLEESRARADEIADERGSALSELADSLMQRAENVKQQSADLIEALEDARKQIAERLGRDLEMPTIEAASAAPGEAPAPLKPVEPPAPPPVDEAPVEEAPPSDEPAEEPAEAEEAEAPEPQPEPDPEPVSTAPKRKGSPASAGARLLATQMAVAGSSREEIASRLENEFGIADSQAMLDGILGPES